ncbi:MAG TPA: RluA family pseudouridine synthase, partial [Bacillota bacterium]|nr:RluA family pseudouridine synthase [Bacillota bacterium]
MPADREATYEYTVREDDVLERLDKFISNLFDDHSRTTIQKMIDAGLVRVNGKNAKSSHVVKPGDFLEIDDLPLNEQDITPEDIPLDIVYEDDSVMVVNKPSGMVVHPAPGNYSHTLVNALVYHIDNLPVKDDRLRPGIVHRIDKDTSGLLMVAKTEKAQILLQDELKRKHTKREYIALLDGVILNETGTIDAPIGRDTKDRKKMAVVKDG